MDSRRFKVTQDGSRRVTSGHWILLSYASVNGEILSSFDEIGSNTQEKDKKVSEGSRSSRRFKDFQEGSRRFNYTGQIIKVARMF